MDKNNHDAEGPIVLDGIFFQFRDPGGIARVWRELLAEWSNTSFAQSVVILDRDGAVPKFPGFQYVEYPAFSSTRAASESFHIDEFCQSVNARFFISTFHTQPGQTPSVVMIHDVIPELLQSGEWLAEKRYLTYNGRAFVAVSENTARDLQRFYPMTKGRPLCVAHNGVSSTFRPVSPDTVVNFKKEHGISKPYFLLCGRRDQHKNAVVFFRAFSNLPQRNQLAIVCCGGRPALEPEFLEFVEDTDVHMLSPDDETLNTAYNGALSLVYPSMYEGFGLPILEAMAAGCSVITCHNSSIPEVGGEAVLYVDDTDTQKMEQALTRVQEQNVRDRFRQAGLERARDFTWKRTADTIAAFLTKLSSREAHDSSVGSYDLRNFAPLALEQWLEFRSYARECENISPHLQSILSSPYLQRHFAASQPPAERLKDLENAWLKELKAQSEIS